MAFELNLIVAVGKCTEKGFPIGVNNKIPWKCKEDLEWFRNITNGFPIIMGRKTFESIGRILPNRLNIIITSSKESVSENINELVFVNNVEDAIEIAKTYSQKAFIIGGGSIYKYVLEKEYIDNIYIDEINVNV